LAKVNGSNGCGKGSDSNACYSVLPGAEGGDGATIIAADVYYWTFELTFTDSVDLDNALSGAQSIKFYSVEQNKKGKWVTGEQLSLSGLYQEGCTTVGGCDPTPPVNVPEPISLALMGAGLFGVGLAQRRRKAAARA
ncbi:MAG: PEP-CTERM sorting domain-containing protein, partial [Gammaproteobacteria bacterium]